MIFVTVGMSKYQFNRLLEEIDRLVGSNKIKEKVIAQIGNSTYKPKNYEYFTFKPLDKILELNKNANIVISHAGAGCIMTALQYNKSLIIVPRLKKYNEHTNDHQIEIAKELERQRKVIAVYDPKNLKFAIKKIKKFKTKREDKEEPTIIRILDTYLKQIKSKGR